MNSEVNVTDTLDVLDALNREISMGWAVAAALEGFSVASDDPRMKGVLTVQHCHLDGLVNLKRKLEALWKTPRNRPTAKVVREVQALTAP
jgi:hypothetical protein